uniref:Uncharacterized protein MANES_06G104100 n=1 Tax=Rhizophora mucronata TaxID=61149 RepID=A0A2P2LWS1_RHIMU
MELLLGWVCKIFYPIRIKSCSFLILHDILNGNSGEIDKQQFYVKLKWIGSCIVLVLWKRIFLGRGPNLSHLAFRISFLNVCSCLRLRIFFLPIYA